MADEAGMLKFDEVGKGLDSLHELGVPYEDSASDHSKHSREWWFNRLIDGDGSLASALNSEIRDGDPNGEGVIWPRIAELSLLGALGCGSHLVDLVIREMEKEASPFHFIVLQSTENSVPFYEKKGFVRVGAVARYFSPESRKKKREALNETNPQEKKKLKLTKQKTKCREQRRESSLRKDEDSFKIGSHLEFNQKAIAAGSSLIPEKLRVAGPSSPYYWYNVNTIDTPTLREVAATVNVTIFDLLFFNRRIYPTLKQTTKLNNNQLIRIPLFPKGFDSQRKTALKTSIPILVKHTDKMVSCTHSRGSLNENGLWYCSREYETPSSIALKLKINAQELVNENLYRYNELETRSKLMPKTILRIPGVRPSIFSLEKDILNQMLKEESCKLEDNVKKETVEEALSKVELLEEEKLRNQIQQDWGFFEKDEDDGENVLSAPMCYRHWAFTDDPVDVTHASYMMVRKITKDPNSSTEKYPNGNNIKTDIFQYNKFEEAKTRVKVMNKTQTVNISDIQDELDKAEIDRTNIIIGSRRRGCTKVSLKKVKQPLKNMIEEDEDVKAHKSYKKQKETLKKSLYGDKHTLVLLTSRELQNLDAKVQFPPKVATIEKNIPEEYNKTDNLNSVVKKTIESKKLICHICDVPYNIPMAARVSNSIKWPKLKGVTRIEELLSKYDVVNLFNKVVIVVRFLLYFMF